MYLFYNLEEATDKNARIIARNCPNLTHLFVSNSHNNVDDNTIGPEGAHEIALRLRKL